MAPPPLVALRGARITFGGPALFEDVSLSLARGERVCLVGRNGSGKSTLLKALAGEVELDGGERVVGPGARLAYLPQETPPPPGKQVADYVAGGLNETAVGDAPRHRVAAVLDRLRLDGGRRLETLSGGEGRRAALARVLVAERDALLLDEPTNHLDLATIEWLERELDRFAGGLVLVSHDRALLARITRRTLWLDRGRLRGLDAGFAAFDDWSTTVLDGEAAEAARLDKRIVAETQWLREGLTARRRRNQGRLRRLREMRKARAARIAPSGRAKLAASASGQSARLVVDAVGVSKAFPGESGPRVVVANFSTRILRGDRVGVIGASGAGKTTLLRLLSGDLAPDKGELRLGANVAPVYFDQRRATLDPEATLWRTLAGEGDTVMVRGRPRHVAGYLRDFLFEERQAQSPVKSLSGGERSRLLLARLLARPGNLLVLDEPTNDLDMETLDLLQEVLGDYDGTLLVASHDRDFLDRVVTGVIAFEGEGVLREYAGGYSDYARRRGAASVSGPAARPRPRGRAKTQGGSVRADRNRLSWREERELADLPDGIETLVAEIRALEAKIANPELYDRDRAAFETATRRLVEAGSALAAAEARWLELEARREALAGVRSCGGGRAKDG